MKSDKVVEKFAEIMIERMQRMKATNWQCGWLSDSACGEMPMNVGKRTYNGGNSFFLLLLSMEKKWQFPVFATIKQINSYGAKVNAGEKSFPVLFWDFSYKKDGKHISEATYNNMSDADKDGCERTPFLKSYNVFNIAQTNLEEVKPKLIERLKKYYNVGTPATDSTGMYENDDIDKMLVEQNWLCPIQYDKPSSEAFYNVRKDMIVVPQKSQFKRGTSEEDIYVDGMMFYDTLMHEMVHSTGHKDRLDRFDGGKFGDRKYAKEELVAELGSALLGNMYGFNAKVQDNNAAYLDNWMKTLKQEPKFIVSVLADVNKACKMILDKVNKNMSNELNEEAA